MERDGLGAVDRTPDSPFQALRAGSRNAELEGVDPPPLHVREVLEFALAVALVIVLCVVVVARFLAPTTSPSPTVSSYSGGVAVEAT
jgi:hypothetical protein